MEGHGVEDCGADAFFFEVLHEALAFIGLDCELVPDVVIAGVSPGQNQISVFEGIEVVVGDLIAVFVPVVESGDFANEDGGLEFGEAGGVSDFVVIVSLAAHSVDSEAEAAAVNLIVVGEDHSTIAGGTKIFGDVETDSGSDAEVSGVGSVVVAVDVLGGIFENEEVVLVGDGFDSGDVSELSEEVNGKNCLGFWGDGGFDFGGIDAHCFPVDVNEYGDGTELNDGFGGGNECECGGDDFITGADVAGLHGDAESVGSAVDTDGVFDAVSGGDDFFEFFVIFPEDVCASGQDLGDCGIQGALYFFVLGFQVDERHVHVYDDTWLDERAGGWF